MANVRRLTSVLFISILSIILVTACGGSDKKQPDRTPDEFTFAALNDQTIDSTVTSEAVTISGLGAEAEITITGGSYSVDGGVTYTAESGTIENEQTVSVQAQTSGAFSTTTTVTVTIGGVEGTLSISTEAEDTTPDAFDLGADTTSATPGEWVESGTITVAGINTAASISIDNGEFQIVGVDTYPSAATTVTNGQQISVRVQAGDTLGTSQTATLTIGGESDTFTVTMVDNTPPTANVQFPTPNTLSDATFVTLRGQANDDFGPVNSIQVVVTTDDGATEVDNQTLTATENDDFQTTWSQRVNLATDKLNTITVTAIDNAGNVQAEPQVLTVTQSTTEVNFPVGEDVMMGQFTEHDLEWDQQNNRLLFATSGNDRASYTVDITTGNRDPYFDFMASVDGNARARDFLILGAESVLMAETETSAIYISDMSTPSFEAFSDAASENSDIGISYPWSIEQSSTGEVYVTDNDTGLYRLSLADGSRTLISNSSRPEGGLNPFNVPIDILIEEHNNRVLITNANSNQLLWVDLDTGGREVFDTSLPFQGLKYIESFGGNEALILESYLPDINGYGALYSVDLITGDTMLLSDDTTPESLGTANSLQYPTGLVVDQEKQIAFVGGNNSLIGNRSSIKVVDITTGERIVLTYSMP